MLGKEIMEVTRIDDDIWIESEVWLGVQRHLQEIYGCKIGVCFLIIASFETVFDGITDIILLESF